MRSPVTALLGPTNTGKTFIAIERMLAHRSGMAGFPLRLLARENYDRVVRLRGARAVALITGEEKILPPNPSYFVCTVESMPLDRPVDFLAVDEIQLCADPERGHVFTARLLHARGLMETMVLGADTIRPLMRRLVPNVEYIGRPRLSTLTHTGHKKVTRLPRRSVASAMATCNAASSGSLEPKTSGWFNARARLPMGSLPGRIRAIRHFDPALVITPPRNAASKPARTSDDLPLPDVPTTARKCAAASLAISFSTCPSRPKKR